MSDFADVLNKASTPPAPKGGEGRDFPDGFPSLDSNAYRVVDTSQEPEGINGIIAYDFKVRRRVFVIYRPWQDCARCTEQVAAGVLLVPDDEGDLECPHTHVKEYQKVVNSILDGKLVQGGNEQETVNRDGSVMVSLKWLEPTTNHGRLRKAKREARKADKKGGVP